MWQTKNQGLEERERERAHGASTATEGDVVEEMTVRHDSRLTLMREFREERTRFCCVMLIAHTNATLTQCQEKKEART